MLSRLTIGRAVLAANVALATVIAVEFVLLVVAIGAQRSSARDARDTEAVLATANKLEKTVLDLETGERGYVIARREEFLAVGAGVDVVGSDDVSVPFVCRQSVFTHLDQNDGILFGRGDVANADFMRRNWRSLGRAV